jgi:hypothetical protein
VESWAFRNLANCLCFLVEVSPSFFLLLLLPPFLGQRDEEIQDIIANAD